MKLFCGVPYTQPIEWKFETVQPFSDKNAVVKPRIEELKFYADFYNDHHRCCWPRTLFDAHLGQVAAISAASPCVVEESPKAERLEHQNSVATDTKLTKNPVVHLNHMATIADQLYEAQLQQPPRSPKARRVEFPFGTPPVFRCCNVGDIVYVFSGRVFLDHLCGSHCQHGELREATLEDVFPLLLVVRAGEGCAGFLQSQPVPPAGAVTASSTQVLLMLEEIAPYTRWNVAQQNESQEVGSGGLVGWSGRYTAFDFICTPLGNEHISSLALGSRRRGGSSTPRRGLSTVGKGDKNLSPLDITLDLYAASYTSDEAKAAVFTKLRSFAHYVPNKTHVMRFGIGATTEYAKDLLGLTTGRLDAVMAKRVARFVSFLDGLQPTPPTVSADRESKRRRISGVPPLVCNEDLGGREAPNRGDEEIASTPLVHCIPMGSLFTVAPIAREWCTVPRSMNLLAVIPQCDASTYVDVRWPLRISRADNLDKADTGEVVECSRLQTLQNLAAALRRITSS